MGVEVMNEKFPWSYILSNKKNPEDSVKVFESIIHQCIHYKKRMEDEDVDEKKSVPVIQSPAKDVSMTPVEISTRPRRKSGVFGSELAPNRKRRSLSEALFGKFLNSSDNETVDIFTSMKSNE
jgi:hypothetical protein